MLLESLTLPLKSDVSRTYDRIRETLAKSDLLEHPWKENPSELFCTVHLVGLSFTMDFIDGRVIRLIAATYIVYSASLLWH